jgi:hypothetical protein
LPPLRPKATAAGFLRGIGHTLDVVEARQWRGAFQAVVNLVPAHSGGARNVVIAAVLQPEGWAAGNLPEALDGVGHGFAAVHDMAAGRVVCLHGSIKPNRLGFVKWGK